MQWQPIYLQGQGKILSQGSMVEPQSRDTGHHPLASICTHTSHTFIKHMSGSPANQCLLQPKAPAPQDLAPCDPSDPTERSVSSVTVL